MHKLLIYKASAGSGKTYKLTEEYLRLAFRIPFHNILAVTFTNKATAEMKDRITGVLDRLANGHDSPYLQILMDDTGMEEAGVRRKAGSLLHEILQNYSRFSVGTIDSFFQRIMRGFARETGLQSGFELELDNRRVLEKVIDRLLVDTSTNEGLRNWMMRYAEERVRDGLSWNFRQDIGRLGNQVFNETFMEFRQEMTGKLSDREFMNSYMASLQKVRNDFEKEMNKIGLYGLQFIEQKGLSVADFIYGSKGVAGYLEKIGSGKKQYEPGKRVLDAACDPEAWYAKKSPKKAEIEDAVECELSRLLNRALDLYRDSYPFYVSSKLILSNFHTLGILNDITRHIREYANENNLFLLSDVASLLAGIIGTNDAPFIYEKTGHFYRHFMIDEFQDTSSIQWKNFVPLITNSLAENNRNILVGDVKQSIYRWRNGDWRILATGIQEDLKTFSPQVCNLEVNWRSKKNIVQFNNTLFSSGPEIITDQFQSEYLNAGLPEELAGDIREQIAKAYAGQVQRLPSGEAGEGGYVNIGFRENEERNWKQNLLDNFPELLTQIRSRGYRLRDIAILVRNKRDGNQIASALMDWQAGPGRKAGVRLDFISEEFLQLQESTSVRLLLAIISHIANPSERMSKAVILNEYCRYLQGSADDQAINHELGKITKQATVLDLGNKGDQATAHDLGNKGDKAIDHDKGNKGYRATTHDLFGSIEASDDADFAGHLPEDFLPRKEYLKQLSLYELIEQLIAIFGLNDHGSEIPYLMGFQDVVLDYSRKEGGGIGPFLEWWEENCGNLSVSSNDKQDAMRIMTIHKAKGLQFKVVLIPFAEWDIDHNPMHDNFLWCRPGIKPFDNLDLVPVKYRSELAGSIFARDYFTEKMQVFVDNLNLLYVAFTRAEEEMHAFTPLPGERQRKSDQVKSISGLLYRALSAVKPEDDAAVAGENSSSHGGDGSGNLPDDADIAVDNSSPQGGESSGAPLDGGGSGSHDEVAGTGDHPGGPVVRTIAPALAGAHWDDRENTFSLGSPGISVSSEKLTGEDLVPENYHVNDFREKLRLRPYGNLFFSGDKDIGKRIDQGRLMHEIFENILTSRDIEKAVMQKCRDGIISRQEAAELTATIQAMTGQKRVAPWFEGSWKVRNETAILQKGGRIRRPDRVMIKDGQVVVVDYKFGDNVQSRYRSQVRSYMSELAEMGYSNLRGYVWYPMSGIIDEVDMINPELEFLP